VYHHVVTRTLTYAGDRDEVDRERAVIGAFRGR
jgi:hypothetical protein